MRIEEVTFSSIKTAPLFPTSNYQNLPHAQSTPNTDSSEQFQRQGAENFFAMSQDGIEAPMRLAASAKPMSSFGNKHS